MAELRLSREPRPGAAAAQRALEDQIEQQEAENAAKAAQQGDNVGA